MADRSVFFRLGEEMARNQERWGPQDHLLDWRGHGDPSKGDYRPAVGAGLSTAARARARVEDSKSRGDLTWCEVLLEEVCETVEAASEVAEPHLGSADPEGDLVGELVQVAAVALAWAEAIERREP